MLGNSDEAIFRFLVNQFTYTKLINKEKPIRDIDSKTFFYYFQYSLSKKEIVYPVFIDSDSRKELTENFKELKGEKIKKFNDYLKENIEVSIQSIKTNQNSIDVEVLINLFHLIGTLRIYGDIKEERNFLKDIYEENIEFIKDIYNAHKDKIPLSIKYSIRQILTDLYYKLEEKDNQYNGREISNIKEEIDKIISENTIIHKFIYTYINFYYYPNTINIHDHKKAFFSPFEISMEKLGFK